MTEDKEFFLPGISEAQIKAAVKKPKKAIAPETNQNGKASGHTNP